MPVYQHRCKNGHVFDVFLKIKDYNEPQTCECGAPSERQIVPTMLNCDMPNWDRYISPTTGKLITSYKERREDMKASGCVDYEPSMKKVQKQKVKEGDAALDKMVDQTVEKQWETMDTSKREKLANELTHSTLEYTRGSA